MAQVRVRKRGKTFSYIFEAGKTADGRRKVVERGGYESKSAAYDAGVAAYNDFKHGNIGITSESITVNDFMTAWLQNVVTANVKPSTLRAYQSYLNVHVVPRLGAVKIQSLTPAMLDKWIRDLQKQGLAYNSLMMIHAFVHHALDYAVYPAQLISSNPATYIKVPRNAPRNVVKRHIITPEQFNVLLEKFPFGSPMHMPLVLLYHTGMRLGEVLGLTWDDVDFAGKRINLRRQMVYVSKRGYFFSTLKTTSSERYILMSERLIVELRRWQARQIENEAQFGGSYVCHYSDADGRIVSQSKGLPHSGTPARMVCTYNDGRKIVSSVAIKYLKRLGLNAHSFRHTHATQLIECGASPKGVAGRLGHSNILITQNLYAHNTLKLQEETLSIFDKNLQTSL